MLLEWIIIYLIKYLKRLIQIQSLIHLTGTHSPQILYFRPNKLIKLKTLKSLKSLKTLKTLNNCSQYKLIQRENTKTLCHPQISDYRNIKRKPT